MNHLAKYTKSGYRRVEGWLDAESVKVITQLAAHQETSRVQGGICEIGVHHGRLFILLLLLSRGSEICVACDLFDNQDENDDASGKGSREHLLRNIQSHGGDSQRVRLIAGNSLRLTPAAIIELCGPVRLFSVDGGHTAEVTCNDLRLAAATTCEGGLVILDDYFNARWPAVSEGTCRFMASDSSIAPVAIVGNKFIFAKGKEMAASYRALVDGLESTVFGEPVVIAGSRSWRERLAQTRLWHDVRDGRVGRIARQLLRR